MDSGSTPKTPGAAHIAGSTEERKMQNGNGRNARRARLIVLALAPIASAMWANSSLGQTLTWDASGANPAAPTDGSGNWLSNNWSNGATDSAWVNGNTAAIG